MIVCVLENLLKTKQSICRVDVAPDVQVRRVEQLERASTHASGPSGLPFITIGAALIVISTAT
jgi:hypothetical protein